MGGKLRIPDAEIRWREYRKDLTEYIMTGCQDGEQVLILGAGACDDLELVQLLESASRVWLADINGASMEKAVEKIRKIKPELLDKLQLIVTDFVSISEKEYAAYEMACQQGLQGLEQWWNRYDRTFTGEFKLFRDIRKQMQQQGIEYFDSVICMGLHSQLYMELFLRTYERKQQLDETMRLKAISFLQQANAKAAESFINEGMKIGKKLFLGWEYTTLYKGEEELQEAIVCRLAESGSVGLQDMQLSRVEGAYQLEQIVGMYSQARKLQITDCQYMFWPFSEEKSYLMVIFTIL